MPDLQSPGVQVTIKDESFYASPGPGTIPFILIATRQDKVDPTGNSKSTGGIAKHTMRGSAGKIVQVTSQAEMTHFFGEPVFEMDGSNVVEGSETSEYGLLAAYSYLGIGSTAYVMRADVDLAQLVSDDDEPTGKVDDGDIWLDTDACRFGVHRYVTDEGGPRWEAQDVTVVVKADADSGLDGSGYSDCRRRRLCSHCWSGRTKSGSITVCITLDAPVAVGVPCLTTTGNNSITYAPHYSTPSTSGTGTHHWIKTTSPGNGLNLKFYEADSNGSFQAKEVQAVESPTTISIPAGASVANIPANASTMVISSLTWSRCTVRRGFRNACGVECQ